MSAVVEPTAIAVSIPIHQLIESPTNPRKFFHQSKLEDLAASIRRLGVIQPVIVRPRGGTLTDVMREFVAIEVSLSAQLDKLRGCLSNLPSQVEKARKVPAAQRKETIEKPVSLPFKFQQPTPSNGSHAISGGLRRMLAALAQRPQGLSARQLGVRAGMSSSSGTFGTYLSKARSEGWIVGGRDRMQISDIGLAALGSYEKLPTGRDLLDYWLGELGGGAGRMLEALAAAYPRSLTKQQLGDAAGLAAGSGTFGTYLSKLRTLELIEGSSELKASEELFS